LFTIDALQLFALRVAPKETVQDWSLSIVVTVSMVDVLVPHYDHAICLLLRATALLWITVMALFLIKRLLHCRQCKKYGGHMLLYMTWPDESEHSLCSQYLPFAMIIRASESRY
jgi:hypothetical protein